MVSQLVKDFENDDAVNKKLYDMWAVNLLNLEVVNFTFPTIFITILVKEMFGHNVNLTYLGVTTLVYG